MSAPVFTGQGRSAEVCPGPWLCGVAVGLPAEPELLRVAYLPVEELKLPCRWQALDQLSGPRSDFCLAQCA